MSTRLLRLLHLVLTPILLAVLSFTYADNVDRVQLEVSELIYPIGTDEVSAFIPFGVVREKRDTTLTVMHRGKSYALSGQVDQARPGDVISLEVTAHNSGELEIVRAHLHRHRKLKWLSGLIAMAILLGLVIRARLENQESKAWPIS